MDLFNSTGIIYLREQHIMRVPHALLVHHFIGLYEAAKLILRKEELMRHRNLILNYANIHNNIAAKRCRWSIRTVINSKIAR